MMRPWSKVLTFADIMFLLNCFCKMFSYSSVMSMSLLVHICWWMPMQWKLSMINNIRFSVLWFTVFILYNAFRNRGRVIFGQIDWRFEGWAFINFQNLHFSNYHDQLYCELKWFPVIHIVPFLCWRQFPAQNDDLLINNDWLTFLIG